MKKLSLIKLILVFGITVGILLTNSSGLFSKTSPQPTKKKILLHMKTNIKKDDGPPCVAFDLAYAALESGYDVEMLFDMQAAYNIKIFEGDGKTDYQRYDLPDDLKGLLAQEFGGTKQQQPKTYQDFLDLLHSKRMKVTVNGVWNALTKVEKTVKGKDHIVKYAEPLTLKEMVQQVASADVYMPF